MASTTSAAPQQQGGPPPDLTRVRELVSCVDAGNALFHCASPAHQLDRYYKDGSLDSCQSKIDDMKLCLHLKMAGADTARKLVAQILGKSDKSPSVVEGVWKERGGGGEAGGGKR